MTSALPDAELAAVTYLRTVTAVTDQVSTRIYTELPANATYPLAVVKRLGGSPVAEGTLDPASIQTEVYADSKQAARDAAAAIQAAFQDARGWTGTGMYVTTTAPQTGLLWLPDESFHPPQPRYVFDTTVYVRNT